jgi:5-methylcytosine-specific restriction endonuclease McrA
MFSIAEKLAACDDPYEFEIPSRNSWAKIAKVIYGDKCMRCGWDRGNCDVHHKIYHRNGGKNTLHNSEVICPNCHRLEHQREDNYYSEETKEVIRMAIQNHHI